MKTLTLPVRFFKYDFINDDIEIVEITEAEFIDIEGQIEYERNTMFENGVNQICLTKTNGY